MKKIRNIFILLSVLVLAILILGFWQTTSFSAYGACRNLVMKTKGYAVWRHESTTQDGLQSQVSFSDEYNNRLTCSAIGIGPLWVATSYSRMLVGCNRLGTASDPCPEDFFGVEP